MTDLPAIGLVTDLVRAEDYAAIDGTATVTSKRHRPPPPNPMPLLEAGDETTLPGCLDGARSVVLPDVGDGLTVGYTVENGEACQGGPGSSLSARTGDLYAFGLGARPRLAQRVGGCAAVGRQPEVRPAEPAAFPVDRGWPVAQQVEREGGLRALREWSTQPPAADESA